MTQVMSSPLMWAIDLRKIWLNGRDSAMVKNKASGAVRCRHRPQARPGGGALPTPSEPRGSYTRKRRDDPADDAPGRPFTARPASPPCNEPPRTRGPVRRATCLFSTDPRPRRQARPRTAPAPTGFARRDRLASTAERPQARRRQVFMRTAWPPVSTTEDRRDEAQRPSDRRRTARPGKGRDRPQTRAHPTPSLRGRAASGRGPTLSRTVRSLTRIRHRDNRAAGPASQIPVHGFRIGRTFHRPFIHGIAHRRAPTLT